MTATRTDVLNRQFSIAWLPLYTYAANGYSFVAGRMSKALRDAGAKMTRPWEEDWDARILIGVPMHSMLGKGKCPDVCLHTMFEAEPMPSYWRGILNRSNAVWTPSQFCADLFRDGGVTAPIFVSGYGVDADFYPARYRDFTDDRKLRFGIWAHAFGDRKNAWKATEAFVKAAPPNSTLDIKVTDKDDIPQIAVDGKVRRDIKVLRGAWNLQALSEWVQSIDVLLYLSGGEGYGLQPLEAMSTGAVCIVAANTGMLDYCTAQNSILIPTVGRTTSPIYQNMFGENLTLAVPNWEAAIDAIRWCANHRDQLSRYSANAIATAQELSWEAAGRKALSHLKAYF